MSVVASLPAREIASRTQPAVVAVSIDNVSKRFPARRSWREILSAPFAKTWTQALLNVSLTVSQGEFFGLLGPNGAGKSTLFKALATLVLPDSGRLVVNGDDVVANPRAVRRHLVPVVADERSLRWRLTARENLRLFAVLYRIPRKEVWTRVDEVLEIVGLSNTGAKLVGQFSTGMKQRLLIARALLARPRVLLLDEPTRGLDPISARSMRRFLKDELCGRQGCTVLLATHSAEEAFHLCDRVGVLDRGRLLSTGRAATLAEAFANDRFRVWTRTPLHTEIASLIDGGAIAEVEMPRPDSDGWFVVDLKIPGGVDAAAVALRSLVTSGAEIARFERAQLSLAELIEREQLRAQESHNA